MGVGGKKRRQSELAFVRVKKSAAYISSSLVGARRYARRDGLQLVCLAIVMAPVTTIAYIGSLSSYTLHVPFDMVKYQDSCKLMT